MNGITWKSCIVTTPCQPKQIELTAQQMRQAGWEEFYICVGRGTKAPERRDGIVARIKEVDASDPCVDYALTYHAFDILAAGSIRDTTFLYFCKPGMSCWEQLQHYCEAQIEPSRLAAWVVHTPTVLIDSERSRRPECYNGDGFYRVRTQEQLLAADAIVISPMAAKLVLSQLPPPEAGLFKTFAQALGNLAFSMPAFELYYHLRSLVSYQHSDCCDFVGVGYDMPNSELTELKELNQ